MASITSHKDNEHKQTTISNINTTDCSLPPFSGKRQEVVSSGDHVCTCSKYGSVGIGRESIQPLTATFLQSNECQDPPPDIQQVRQAGDSLDEDSLGIDSDCLQPLTDRVAFLQNNVRNPQRNILDEEHGSDYRPLVNEGPQKLTIPQDSCTWSKKYIAVLILLLVVVLGVTTTGVLLATTWRATSSTTTATTTSTTIAKTTATTTTTTTTVTTTKPTTTPVAPIPSQCVGATNFNQYWRLDHNGSNIRPWEPHHSARGYACDTYGTVRYWFRFIGAAGNRMLNTCPKMLSCGTRYPMWTDDVMPSAIGEKKSVVVYVVNEDGCRGDKLTIQVVRCSLNTDYDFVYQSLPLYLLACNQAFCGMR